MNRKNYHASSPHSNNSYKYFYTKFASAASNPKQFPKVALSVILSSTLLGYGLMQLITTKQEDNMKQLHTSMPPSSPSSIQEYNNNTTATTIEYHHAQQQHQSPDKKKRNIMSNDELLVRAMVENAKSSTMKENLENAYLAHKNFMLPNSNDDNNLDNEKDIKESMEKDKERNFVNRILRKSEEIQKR
mmetsp:Transcript_274/g.370  ORF Transcript_274/g.370 Transcript_274/m.370 type:complete len:188 (-) Transcript_274:134-697(-)